MGTFVSTVDASEVGLGRVLVLALMPIRMEQS